MSPHPSNLMEATAAAYLRMSEEVDYRPYYIHPPEVDDLKPEALKYADHFLTEEDDCTFNIGCPDGLDRAAFVFLIEAARLLCAVEHRAALQLLDMARAEMTKPLPTRPPDPISPWRNWGSPNPKES